MTVVKPLMTPLSSIRSTRRLTAGADKFTFSPISAPLLFLIFLVAWVLGRRGAVYSLYERCLLTLSIVLGLVAVRNWPFATLLVLMLVPAGIDRSMRRDPPRQAPVIGAPIALAAGAVALLSTIGALTAPSAKLTRNFPDAAADAAAAATLSHGAGARVYGGIQYSDWLLWRHPELRGHVVFDVRYELLRPSEVKRLVLFSNGSGLDRPLGRPGVYVLDPGSDRHAIEGLRGTVRIIYKTEHVLVAVTKQVT